MTRDPLDEMRSRDPGVRELVNALVSPPADDELAGEQTARAMFAAFRSPPAPPAAHRSHRAGSHRAPSARAPSPRAPSPRAQPARAGRSPVRPRGAGRPASGPGSRKFGVWRTVAATTLALTGALVLAAYLAVLPGPVQLAAHRLLGQIGVPLAHSTAKTAPTAAGSTPAGPHRHFRVSPAASSVSSRYSASQTASPSPGRSRSGNRGRDRSRHRRGGRAPHSRGGLIVTAPARPVRSGSSVHFYVTLTEHGKPQPNVPLVLHEHSALQSLYQRHHEWPSEWDASTDAHGLASFTVPELWANASFVVTGPGSLHSRKVNVVVIASVQAGIGRDRRQPAQDFVFVNCLLARPGDAATLEVRYHGHWRIIGKTKFSQYGRFATAWFMINADRANRTYRVVLPATSLHGNSASGPVKGVSEHHRHEWDSRSPAPLPSPAPSPSPGPPSTSGH
ncbi:MAG TPA: hypothetical protein VMA95_00625 [Streptosporangiaceae bacterium]|nr:hypothetical protein [Streptosporangiaceae bacterium]